MTTRWFETPPPMAPAREAELRRWLERFEALEAAGGDHPCKHGHLGCSTHDGGPCLDETLAELEAAGLEP